MESVIIGIVILVIVGAMKMLVDKASTQKEMVSALGQTKIPVNATINPAAFKVFDKYISNAIDNAGIAIDRENKFFAFLTSSTKELVPFQKILSSEICVDSDVIVTTDRASQIGGALAAGALTGGIGAIVVAMGAKKKHTKQFKKVDLRILTIGTVNPIWVIPFYIDGWGTDGEEALKNASKWHDLIAVAIAESRLSSL